MIATPPENWGTLPRALLTYKPEPKSKADVHAAAKKPTGQGCAREKAKEATAADILARTRWDISDLERLLNAVAKKAIEPGRKFRGQEPPPQATSPGDPSADETLALPTGEPPPGGSVLNARPAPKFDAQAKSAAMNACESLA